MSGYSFLSHQLLCRVVSQFLSSPLCPPPLQSPLRSKHHISPHADVQVNKEQTRVTGEGYLTSKIDFDEVLKQNKNIFVDSIKNDLKLTATQN